MKRSTIALLVLLAISLVANVVLIVVKSEGPKPIVIAPGTGSSKTNFVRTIQEQHRAELSSLRELAVKEGATKTTEAIDKALAGQQVQFRESVRKAAERERTALKERSARGRIRIPRDEPNSEQ